MRVAVLSANLGGYDPHIPWVPQVIDGGTVEIHRFTDATFPGREKAMRPALKCAIPKMFGWELVPHADTYIWIDASRGVLRPDTAQWFLDQAGAADLMLFKHPERSTVREEYEFMRARLARAGERYLTSRYGGEWLDDQYRAVDGRLPLYASTAFLYRPTLAVKALLKEWWFHKTRYLLHDQLSLPYVVQQGRISGDVRLKVIDANVYDCPHLPFTRKMKTSAA
jgi:hypothetical protein